MRIRVPADFVLARDACSYGYFLLAPNVWEPESATLTRAFELSGGPAVLRISQRGVPRARAGAIAGARTHWSAMRGNDLCVRCSRGLSRSEQGDVRAQITRMLRLDEDEREISAFHRVDARWKREGRGRLFRSPTLFEDIIKTVTSCNVQWPSTVHMNLRLCEVLGRGGAFPSPVRLARARAATLRARCRVGYRDARIIELARLHARGEIDEAWLSSARTRDDDVFLFLKTLPGIGPYAAANIMQLLGRYARLPLDTESVRHGRVVLGFEGSDAQVMRQVHEHFAPFGDQAFRSYWFELWAFYERKAGPSEGWKPKEVARAFTASSLKERP